LVVIGMMILYVTVVLRSSDESLSGKKGLWVTVLLAANVFALPAFWAFHIRRTS